MNQKSAGHQGSISEKNDTSTSDRKGAVLEKHRDGISGNTSVDGSIFIRYSEGCLLTSAGQHPPPFHAMDTDPNWIFFFQKQMTFYGCVCVCVNVGAGMYMHSTHCGGQMTT